MIVDWIYNNLVLCGVLGIVFCFAMYYAGRLFSAGWYKSKLSFHNTTAKNSKNGGGVDE